MTILYHVPLLIYFHNQCHPCILLKDDGSCLIVMFHYFCIRSALSGFIASYITELIMHTCMRGCLFMCHEMSSNFSAFCCRLRASRVLLIGLGGLGAEVAKNIVLAGVRSLTLLDDQNVCYGSCFAVCTL